MSAEAQETPTTRTRRDDVAQPRRRRDEMVGVGQHKMNIPAGVKAPGDDEKFVYRWANDEGARLYQLTQQDDWDYVSADGKASDRAGAVTYRLGANKDGTALNAYLLRKPRPFMDEDKKKKAAAIKKSEDARLKEIPDDAPEHVYKPK